MKPHTPVLVDQVVDLLSPAPGKSYLDLTAGFGGHAEAIARLMSPQDPVVLVDRDAEAIRYLEDKFGDRAELINSNFLDAVDKLSAEGRTFDMILADVGVSSPQLDNAERGFSFASSGPLDMRMDRSQELTAETVVNTYSQDRLAEIISQFGEERFAKRVARAIVTSRPLVTTSELAGVVRKAIPGHSDINPATRTFQAIRIEVNAELGSLEQTLSLLPDLLTSTGRLAVISFHSLEDRIVKQFIDLESRGCICPPKQPICTCNHVARIAKLTKGAIKGEQFDSNNPRARSAKLRAAVKIKNQKEGIV